MLPVKVLVYPLLERFLYYRWHMALMRIAARASVDHYMLYEADPMREDLARENAVKTLLASDCSHLLMLDLDHNHPEDIVRRLREDVIEDRERHILGALCFRRTANYEPLAFIDNPEGGSYFPYPWPKGIVKVNRVGNGAKLIDRRVFEAMPGKGWFRCDYSRVAEGVWPSSDITFDKAAEALGFGVYVDTRIVSPHHTDGWVDDNTFKAFVATNEAARQQIEEVGDDS